MKKRLIIPIILLLLIPLILAQDSPSPAVGEEDYNKLKGIIDNNTPIDKDGKVNLTKFQLNKAKAEIRIEAVNNWVKTNASWLKFIFGMVPEISWLFAINLWIWLLFFTVLVLKGKENLGEKGILIGLGSFIILLTVKFYYIVAKALHHILDIIINVIIPWGIIITIITLIILVILAIWFWPVTLRLLTTLTRFLGNASKQKGKKLLAKKLLQTQAKAMQPS